jgi:hypothetical protein
MCHNIGSLLPESPHSVPVTAQVYVVDPAYQANLRSRNRSVLHQSTVAILQELLHELNVYARDFMRISDVVRDNGGSEDVTMILKKFIGVPT